MFPERQYQNGLPVFIKILYRVLMKIAVQKCFHVFRNC